MGLSAVCLRFGIASPDADVIGAGSAEDSLVLFLAALTDLARRAARRTERLYCYVTF